MENINLLPENEYTEADGRKYLQPNLPVTQTNQFIDNYRANQQANNQQINQQTQNLGTTIPSVRGGLTGGNSYFTSRYQTPQTNAALQSLRATAQANALNTALANEQAYWQKKYQDAYKAQQKRAWDKSNAATGGSGNKTTTGGVDYKNNADPTKNAIGLTANAGETVVSEVDTDTGAPTGWVNIFYPDGTSERKFQGLTYSHDVGRNAGVEQLSDVLTGMYNYTLNDNRELELGGWDENLVKGSDGQYYIWNKPSNTYTLVSGDSGSTEGGTRWWK